MVNTREEAARVDVGAGAQEMGQEGRRDLDQRAAEVGQC